MMLSVWLYLIGAATAGAYAIGASLDLVPPSPSLAAACLGVAAAFVLSAELSNRRSRLRAAGEAPAATPLAEQDDHTLVDGIDDIVFQTDRSAALTFLNRSWKTVTALDARDCLGTSFFDYLHPDDQTLNREQFLTILQPGKASCHFETRLICRDGRQRWVDVRLKPRHGRHGQINGATGIMTDVHSRKRAEDVLRARDRSLSTLLDHLPGMAFRCRNDRHWTMEFINEGCFDLTGYEAVDLLDHLSYDQLILPEDRSYVWDYVQSQLAQQKAFHLRYRIRTREGRVKWVEERSRGIFAGNGTLLAIEGFVSDISNQKRDEERIAQESLRDTFTGLKSRALLLDRVSAAIEDDAAGRRPFALLYVDIDNLKRINERHGRSAGDELLVAVGRRLAQLCGAGISVGRLGGDEFGVLVHQHAPLPGGALPHLPELARFAGEALSDPHGAGAVCATAWVGALATALDAPFEVDDAIISIGARVGVALCTDRADDAEAMLRDAMQAAVSAQWQVAASAVRYGFAGTAARQSAETWRHSAKEFGRAFDAGELAVTLAPAGNSGWIEGSARWHGARTAGMPSEQLFLHAYQAGTLQALVSAYVEAVCAEGLPLLQPGQRLAIRLDALAPAVALEATAPTIVSALRRAGADARAVPLLILPAGPHRAPKAADLQPLREAGIDVAVDITAAVTQAETELPGWPLLAECWRIALGPEPVHAEPQPSRLSHVLDLAARRGIGVVTGACRHAAPG